MQVLRLRTHVYSKTMSQYNIDCEYNFILTTQVTNTPLPLLLQIHQNLSEIITQNCLIMVKKIKYSIKNINFKHVVLSAGSFGISVDQ